MIKGIKNTLTGLRIIRDMFGESGKPEPIHIARYRASVCATCPKNIKGDWMDRLKKGAADAIKVRLEIKHRMRLTLTNEHELGFCEQCGCVLSLKCWTPMEHIMAHTPLEEVAKYPSNCWISKALTSE
jgi:hypothetical protein